MKRVLFITEKFPYPLDTGGKIRTFYILKGLSREYSLTLVTTGTKDQEKYFPNLEHICDKVFLIDIHKIESIKSCLDAVLNFASSVPFIVKRHYSAEVGALIKKLANDYDIIHLDHLDSSVYIEHLPPGKPVVLDEHNIVSNQLKTYATDTKFTFKGIYAHLQHKKTLRYEQKICNAVQHCLVCSDVDKDHLRSFAKDAVVSVVPNGVDIDYFCSCHSNSSTVNMVNDLSVVFVGALDYGPGESAVRYFYKEILPLLREHFPELKFIAVGQNPPNNLLSLAKDDKKFILTGRVEDVRDYIRHANVFVVPLRSGSGTRLKILTAMSMNVPVVSTSIGAEGLTVRHEENILIADTPQAFCSEVSRLINDRVFTDKISRSGRMLVEELYSWDVVWSQLLSVYRNI